MRKRPITDAELIDELKLEKNIGRVWGFTRGAILRGETLSRKVLEREANRVGGISLERGVSTPRPKDKRPFYPYDSNKEIFSELRDTLAKKAIKKYPLDGPLQMEIKNMPEKDLVELASSHDFKLIEPGEKQYLEDRLSGRNHDVESNDSRYISPLKERDPVTPLTARQREQSGYDENNVSNALKASRAAPTTNAGVSARGLEAEAPILRSSSSSRPRSVSTQRARTPSISALDATVNGGVSSSSSPIVDRIREAQGRAEESRSSLSASSNDPINQYAERLGEPREPERVRTRFADEVLDPTTGIRGDPVDPKSRFSTKPDFYPEEENEYSTLAAQIPKNIEDARTVDMTNRTFKDTLDARKLTFEKKIEGYNAPRTYFKNSGYVDPNDLQEEAYEEMMTLHDPYSEKKVKEQNELLRTLRPALTKNYASDSAKPFLDRLAANPADYHKDLMGNVEENHLNTINDRATREFNEKVLPGIMAKYQVPGLRQHGHMGRDIGMAAELAERGRHEALSKAAVDIRGLTLNAGLMHANLQAQGANTAGRSAVEDIKNRLSAVKSASDTQKAYSNEKKDYTNQKLTIGNIQRAEKMEKRRMEQAHLLKPELDEQAHIERLALGMNAVRDPNIKTSADIEQRTPVTVGNNQKALAKAAGGAGRSLIKSDFEEDFAKGGIVKKKRLKRAEGGSVNSLSEEAIENALIQHTDPLAELRRLFNVDIRKQNPWETKKYYAFGGQVSPIKAGADAANEYAAQRSQITRIRTGPKKKPLFLSVLDAGMEAAAGPNGGAFGNVASGWKSDLDNETTHNKQTEERLSKADELEYKLEKDIKEQALKEQEMAHKKDDLLRQEKIAEAQIGHYGAQNAYLGLQGDKLKYDMNSGLVDGQDKADVPRAGQKAHERDKVSEYSDKATLASKMKETIGKIRNVLDRVSIGPRTGQSIENLGPTLTAALKSLKGDKSKEKDYILLSQLRTQLIRQEEKLEHVKGLGNRSNMGIQLMLDSKLHEGLAKEDFISGLASKEQGIDLILDDLSNHIRRNKGSDNEIGRPLKYKSPVITKVPSPGKSTPPAVITPAVGGKTQPKKTIKDVSEDELRRIVAGG